MPSVPPSAVRLTLIMCIAETVSMTGFAAYTTLLPQLQGEWALSNSEAGLIGGVVLSIIGGIIGSFVKRWSVVYPKPR